MKDTKKLVTLAVALTAAAAIMASAASAASADTVLCETSESPCSAAHTFPAGTAVGVLVSPNRPEDFTIHLNTAKGQIPFTMSCNYVVFGARTTAEEGEPLSAAATELTTDECGPLFQGRPYESSHCSLTQNNPPVRFIARSSGNGLMVFGTGENHWSYIINCKNLYGLGVNYDCTYGTSGARFIISGSENSEEAVEAPLTHEAGTAGCTETATLTVKAYQPEELGQRYVSRR